MARELKEGISREFRYMEYKLRKKRSNKDSDKKKNKNNQFGSYPTMDEFGSNSISEEYKDSLPSSSGEADLQLQVALAMSREEAEEKEKAEKLDKAKLDLALKESIDTKQKPKQAPASNDPWGSAPSASAKSSAIFDPFEAPTQAQQSNGFGSDAWASSAVGASNNATPQVKSTWSPPKHAALVLPPPQSTAPKANDPWGPTKSPTTVSDPWNSSPASQLSSQGIWDAPSQPTSGQNDNFAAAFSPQGSGIMNQSSSDPLKDFDDLRISSGNQQLPMAPDMLGRGNIMVPMQSGEMPSNGIQLFNENNDFNDNQKDSDKVTGKADAFLGKNASLVNIDNLVSKPKTSAQYQTLNTNSTGMIGASRNPFNQKGPSLSLNEIKGGPVAPVKFQQPVAQGQSSGFPGMMNQMPMGYGMPATGMQMQPTYVNSSNPFGQGGLQPNAFPQQNQYLF